MTSHGGKIFKRSQSCRSPHQCWFGAKKKKNSCEKEGDVMIWSRKKEEEAWCEKEGDGEADKKRENVERSERKREGKGRENERLEERENIKKIIPSCYSALIFECTVARYQN